ncbi:MAG: alpha/beta hydrolase [Ectothiorhodospiraceae bacterium]|nr:alpha/beta hydrolase [Ectothiorhodospiraceae bacterium]
MPELRVPDLLLSYRREGAGPPLVLLHGWPEWSTVWRHNVPALAERFDVVAPDLRNFGDSVGAEARNVEHYVDDLEALVDALGLERFGLVSHDVGAFVAQLYARRHPGRLAGLFFLDCPHFGLGPRWVEGAQVREIWYQSFHQLPLAESLVGASRESCRAYLAHFLSHWSHRPTAFDDALDEWTDMFLRPGRLAGGFRWYAVASARRLAALRGEPVESPPPIAVPTYTLWGASDPILPARWAPTLHEVFSDLRIEIAPEAGHFVHWEQPALANARIVSFFAERFAPAG